MKTSLITFISCITMIMADDGTGGAECTPLLADRCFSEIYDKLPCHIKSTCSTSNTTEINNDMNEFCSALYDSLNCLSDIIDSDCSKKDGKDIFDTWLNGLRAVDKFLCGNINETLRVIIENAQCWNGGIFLECIKTTTNLHHVVDIMHAALDIHECILVISGLAECNTLAGLFVQDTNQPCSSQKPKELLDELVHIFFSQTYCNSNSHSFSSSSSLLTAPVFTKSLLNYKISYTITILFYLTLVYFIILH
ncbi:uncharacterized protein LOC142318869 [Lycorma delicatula]|uniref:uncharacterized protein LOC142318869 n=1 Tax=Lycorma delicatula TaxID=130591 RepID=UPI003F5163E0